jgi:DNA transformation protein and related proteins
MGELINLKNIGAVSAKWLSEIGVNNHTELGEMGAIQAFLRIKFREPKATLNLLYALWGAIENVSFNEIPASVRSELKREVTALLELGD